MSDSARVPDPRPVPGGPATFTTRTMDRPGPPPSLGALPRVSICIPSYQGAPWIRDAVRSALAQTMRDIEVLVVDDGSTDGTAALARAVPDPRVRVVENPRNLGLVANWNRCLCEARGEHVKFLFQDDLLRPDCVERMLAEFAASPRVGLVFARREILLDDPEDPWARQWERDCGVLPGHRECRPGANPGRCLFDRWIDSRGWGSNWLGEPTAVMLRRTAVDRVGGFNARLTQLPDAEMWLRMAFHFDVGFVDEPLAVFRVHARSTTWGNLHAGNFWFDPLWVLEGCLRDPEIRAARPDLDRRRLGEVARQMRRRVRYLKGRRPPVWRPYRAFRDWLVFRSLVAAGRAPALHGWAP